MASHFKLPLMLLLLLFCIATTTSNAARPGVLPHGIIQRPASHTLRPQDFPNERLYRAYLVIQRFKGTITADPKNITMTWTGRDICGQTTYVGFYCAKPLGQDKDLTVTAVVLNGFGLRAPKLQGFVDQLPDLALFHAASNDFGSDIPLLDNLPYQYQFSIGNALLPQQYKVLNGNGANTFSSGCVTATINFNFNIGIDTKKGGTIPGITDAKALLLNYNNLSGNLPANIGSSKLSYLALANNKLSGPIPPSIRHAQDTLLEVLLLNNQLTGCLPHELGMLTKAAVIDAGFNQLTGPIPSSFSCLRSVEQLNLGANSLYGEIPDELCKLSAPAGRLANLTLSSNYFTSIGPSCTALIKDGVLDVKHNCIPGFADQRRPVECASFLSQPKICPASTDQVTCPAVDDNNTVEPEERKGRDYSSYVTYATLHK